MSLTEDYWALVEKDEGKKKKKKQSAKKLTGNLTKDYYALLEEDGGTAPVRSTIPTKGSKTRVDEDDIAPVLSTSKKDDGFDFFQKGAFEDGYQFGDVTKAILGTVGDIGTGVVKGASKMVGGILDAGTYGVAGIADAMGNDDFADELRVKAKENVIDNAFKDWDERINQSSILGRTSDSIAEGLGQVASVILTGGLGAAAGGAVGATVATTGMMGVSSFGSGMSEAYQSGATDEEAATYGLIKGVVDAGSELIFGGLGKAVKAVGLSKGLSSLDDVFARKLADKITSQTAKNFVEYGVKASAEGVEEVLAGIGSAVGKKLTYMDEAELSALVADENLLEQFVVGAVTSGVAQSGLVPGMKSGSLAEANKTGRDFITGNTVNEQKVIDKEYENRIAEQEKDGRKLSEKEKSKIYDAVVSDMEKGYISTDTIEEVLGGDTYKSYKDTVDSEDALQNEFDTLNKMKQGDMTGEQIDRRAELKEQLAEIKNADKRSQMQSQLRDEVFGLVKGDRLVESYNERARKGQAFEADLSKYDAKQQTVIQKAVESGILNNTNRTHEFVDMIAKISADKGVLFDFTNNEKLKGTSFAVDGKTVNGFVNENGVTLNIDSAKSLNSVVGHEITHVLEGTDLYDVLQKTIVDYAKSKGDYQGRYDTISRLYADQKGANIDAELTADLVGDYLFTDSDFIHNLSANHRNVFQKIYDEIKYLCKVATAGSKEARELEKVKRAFDKAYKADGKAQTETKHSLSDSDGKQLSEEQQEFFKYSKVRDEQGSLLVVYHGTGAEFTVFDHSRVGQNYGNVGGDLGFYFSPYRDDAKGYARNAGGNRVESVYLNLKNPLIVEDEGWGSAIRQADIRHSDLMRWAKAGKHDGIIVKSTDYDMGDGEFDAVYIAFSPEQIKRTDNLNPTKDADIRYSLSDSDYLDAVNRGDTDSAQMMVDEAAKNAGYTVKAYHGTARADRVGNVFLPERATSGPMAFFTDNKKIAENYARDKADTSMAYDPDFDSYETQFRIKAGTMDIPLYKAWSYLPFTARKRITEKAGQLREDWDGDNELMLDPDTNEANGGFQWQLKEARGNAIKALTEQWLNSGTLFNEEARFLDVLEMAGVTEEVKKVNGEVYFKDPSVRHEKVYDTYLKITKPFDTSKVDEQFVAELEAWYDEQDQSQYDRENMHSDMWDKNGIDAYDFAERLRNDIERGTAHAWTSIPDSVTDYLKHLGYDGIKDTGGKNGGEIHTVWIPFSSEQVKSAEAVTRDDSGKVVPLSERFNPEKTDIRYSIGNDRRTFGNYNVYGEDIALETAPVSETTAETKMPASETKAEPMFPDDLAPMSEPIPGQFDSLTDEDMPPEMEAPYYEDNEPASVDDPFENRYMDEVGSPKVKAYMFENPEVKPFFQQEAAIMLRELQESTKGQKLYNDKLYYDTNGEQGWFGQTRNTSEQIAYLLDGGWGGKGYTYAEIEKGLKAIIEDNGKENNACSKRIEFLLNDRLKDGYTDFRDGSEIPPDEGYLSLLDEKQITEYSKEAFDALVEDGDEYAPSVQYDIESNDPAPTPEALLPDENEVGGTTRQNAKGQQKLFPESEPSKPPVQQEMWPDKTAKILTEEPPKNKNQRGLWSMFKEYVLDNGMVFEDLSLKTGNRELQAKWHYIRNARAMAQSFMGKGKNGARALNDLRQMVENSGKMQSFSEYAYHLLNVDRMTLAQRYEGMENKPVFGNHVTAEQSAQKAVQLERANPEFKRWAKELYTINTQLREMLVEGGVLSRETADLWAEMYPHYIPIRRAGYEGAAINVALDTNRTGVNAPIKKATGGNRDILPMFDTMGQRTLQTYRAIAKNRFGLELRKTLGTTVSEDAAGLDSVIDSMDNEEGLLTKGDKNNAPTFTVFENGKRYTFEITDEMYESMKPTSDLLAYTNPVLNTASNAFRGLLTEYNPVFMMSNAIKDAQDVLINSQHPARTYMAMPKAIGEMMSGGNYYREYMENGGEENTYFDGQENNFDTKEKGARKLLGIPPLSWISKANNVIERLPRMAEYIASREDGRSIEVSMLDAARVTTNFAAGGKLTKFANRNGVTFLNASVQGAVQQARNIREAKANGLKGAVYLAAKVAVAGLPAMLVNHLLWDDDEDYEELSDYVKQDYYIVGKTEDGQFIRIPKGRTLAVIQNAFEQMENLVTGDDEVDLKAFLDLAVANLAPNNPIENNILAPIKQVAENKTWYGEDLVPTRLQDLPKAEQFDESTDSLSKWLGERQPFLSPYQINYLLDQYSGGVGDVFLPMLTPEAESGDNSLIGNFLAPLKKKFTTDAVMNNQNVSDFYDTKDELATNAKRRGATDEDVLKSKYFNSINSELSDLYAQKREIQNSTLPDDAKYEAVRDIQSQIVELTKEALNDYPNVSISGNYAEIGNRQYRKNDTGEWTKLSDKQTEKQDEVTGSLNISASEYWRNKEEYDFAYEKPEKYAVAKSVGGYTAYKDYTKQLYDIKGDDLNGDGRSDSGTRKKKVLDWINNLDADYGTKIILFKNEYNADDTYNYEIIEYLNSRSDISAEEMAAILKELGFEVDSKGNISW